MSRETSTGIRTTADERELWTATAHRMGHRGMGSWLRALAYEAQTLDRSGRELVDELRDVRRGLARVGNNVNQLARAANSGETVELANSMAELATLNRQLSTMLHSASP